MAELTYTRNGDYLIPDITLEQSADRPLGKYGRMRRTYLQEKPAAIKDFYTDGQLVALTRELTEQLRKSRTIDWQKKESARAEMRVMVKRLLKRYKYPPEGLEDAMDTVIGQCELWTDNIVYG